LVGTANAIGAPQPEGHMGSHIERRKFLATLGGAAVWPLAARADRWGSPGVWKQALAWGLQLVEFEEIVKCYVAVMALEQAPNLSLTVINHLVMTQALARRFDARDVGLEEFHFVRLFPFQRNGQIDVTEIGRVGDKATEGAHLNDPIQQFGARIDLMHALQEGVDNRLCFGAADPWNQTSVGQADAEF
jgi:hypothetical protein